MKSLLLLLIVALGIAVLAQEPVTIGKLKFTPPKGWAQTSESGTAAAVYAAPGLPTGKTCQVRVFPDEVSTESFDIWINRKWSKEVSSKRLLQRTSAMTKQKLGAIEVALRSGAYKEGGGEAYVLLVGLVAEGHSVYLLYESNDFEIFDQHQAEVFGIFDTMDIGDGKAPEKPVPSAGTGASTQASIDVPTLRAAPRLAIPTALPAGCPMPAGTPDEAAAILAKRVTAYTTDSLPALVTAVRASGFTIRTPDRKLVAKPLSAKGNGCFVEDQELLTYFAMSARGDSLSAEGVLDAVDFVLDKANAPFHYKQLLPITLASGLKSPEPHVRFFSRFIVATGGSMPQPYDLSTSQAGKPTRMTPLEMFLTLRVFTTNARRQILTRLKRESDVHGPALEADDDTPGYEEDFTTFTETFTISQFIEALGKDALGTILNSVNMAVSFGKFLATYYCLEADFSVAAPGEPLVRTHSSSQNGERRTLQVQLKMNTSKLQQFLKEYRRHLAITGIDFDMPQAGAMAKAEVRWRLLGYTGMNTLDKPVQFVGSNIEITQTDDNGIAKLDIEGTKQRQTVPPSAPPVKMQIPISVMVQVKAIEIKQDLVDAFTSAVGVSGANPFWAVPGIMQEMVFRSKILVNGTMNLKFIDWTPGSLKAAFSITISGHGTMKAKDNSGKTVWSVDRQYMAEGWLVPDLSGNLPQVASVLRGTAGNRTYFKFVRSADHWSVNDSEVRDFVGACGDGNKIVSHFAETFNGPLPDGKGHPANNNTIDYVYDYTTKKMYLDIREPSVDGTHRDHVTQNGKVTRNLVEDIGFGLFPRSMSTTTKEGKPLGRKIVEYQDPTEVPAGGAIQGDFPYSQEYRYHNNPLDVKYQFVIKPSYGDSDGSLLHVFAKRSTLGSLLGTMVDRSALDEVEELPTCLPTNPGPLRSLRSVTGKRR